MRVDSELMFAAQNAIPLWAFPRFVFHPDLFLPALSFLQEVAMLQATVAELRGQVGQLYSLMYL